MRLEVAAFIEATTGLVYLASPYSHENELLREHRFVIACRVAANLMKAGLNIFSPIAHSHPIAQFGLPQDLDFWMKQDRLLLDACDAMIVLKLKDWKESKGVAKERWIMVEAGKPILYLNSVEAREVGRIYEKHS